MKLHILKTNDERPWLRWLSFYNGYNCFPLDLYDGRTVNICCIFNPELINLLTFNSGWVGWLHWFLVHWCPYYCRFLQDWWIGEKAVRYCHPQNWSIAEKPAGYKKGDFQPALHHHILKIIPRNWRDFLQRQGNCGGALMGVGVGPVLKPWASLETQLLQQQRMLGEFDLYKKD